VLVISLVKELARRSFNATIVAGVSGVYLSSGFGPREWLYFAIATPFVYLGLRSYRFIGSPGILRAGDCLNRSRRSFYEESRCFKAVRVPGFALILRQTPFSSYDSLSTWTFLRMSASTPSLP
jgi:hypothetical protein